MIIMDLSKGESKHLCLSFPKALRRSVSRCRVNSGTAEPVDKAVVTLSNRPGRTLVLPER